jgi:uncharacterized damage-inducible protein DinB
MKEVVQLLAEYNALTNIDMIKILETLPEKKINDKSGAYFESVLGLLNHLLTSDIIWVKFFTEKFEEASALKSDLPDLKQAKWKEIVWTDLETYKKARLDFDRTIKELFSLIPEDKYKTILSRRNFKGEEEKITAWHSFIHLFNHETHHRGQIAVLLDQLGIENDFSNLIWRFKS